MRELEPIDASSQRGIMGDSSSSQLDAAVGIKNGLFGGIAFWSLAFVLYSLFRFFA